MENNIQNLKIQFEESTKNYIKSIDNKYRKVNSQFFTPYNIAVEMANTIECEQFKDKTILKILEPAAGTGMLILPLCLKIVQELDVDDLEITLYETDSKLCRILSKNLFHLKVFLEEYYSVRLVYQIHNQDFLLDYPQKGQVDKFSDEFLFDIIIANPPFRKINKSDQIAQAFRDILYGQPNIYQLFIAMSLKCMKDDGIFLALTPRNYLSGKYSEKLRKWVFKNYLIQYVHSFYNRNIFKRVNQEVIIAMFSKKNCNYKNHFINFSYNGCESFKELESNLILDNYKKIMMIPTKKLDLNLIYRFRSFNYTLRELGIELRVGPIVQFRNKGYLSKDLYNEKFAPLILGNDVKINSILYNDRQKKKKAISMKRIKYLVPNSNYLLVRKIAAKDDKEMIVSAVLSKNYFDSSYIGIDNNILFFSGIDRELMLQECYGLYCILNSSYFAEYYSLINGTHTINVYEFYSIKFPDIECLKELGEKLLQSKDYSSEKCDSLLIEILDNNLRKYEYV